MKAVVGYGAFALMALSGDALSGCIAHSCTEIGCIDGYALTIRRADGAPPTEHLEVDYGDEHVVCSVVSLDDRYTACSIAVALMLVDQVTCTEHETGDSSSQSCTPTGKYELELSIQGLPAAVHVTLHDGDTVVSERSASPKYASFQPNGEGCEPTCKQASDLWDLPE